MTLAQYFETMSETEVQVFHSRRWTTDQYTGVCHETLIGTTYDKDLSKVPIKYLVENYGCWIVEWIEAERYGLDYFTGEVLYDGMVINLYIKYPA